MVESEERRKQSGPQGSHVPSNSIVTESALVSEIKPLKFEFPRFQRDDPACQIHKANQFFYCNMPEHQMVLMPSYHMDNKESLVWFLDAETAGLFVGWKASVNALQIQFGTTTYDDPMERLYLGSTKLLVWQLTKANSKLYRTKSQDFLNHSCFLSGLKDAGRGNSAVLKNKMDDLFFP